MMGIAFNVSVFHVQKAEDRHVWGCAPRDQKFKLLICVNDSSLRDATASWKICFVKNKKIFQTPKSLRYVPGVALVHLTKGPLPS